MSSSCSRRWGARPTAALAQAGQPTRRSATLGPRRPVRAGLPMRRPGRGLPCLRGRPLAHRPWSRPPRSHRPRGRATSRS
eukprot:2073822-Alexandrium_andersonii.AAC.1